MNYWRYSRSVIEAAFWYALTAMSHGEQPNQPPTGVQISAGSSRSNGCPIGNRRNARTFDLLFAVPQLGVVDSTRVDRETHAKVRAVGKDAHGVTAGGVAAK
jgi:hypothetical protein